MQGQNANFENSLSVKSKQDVLAKNRRNKSLKSRGRFIGSICGEILRCCTPVALGNRGRKEGPISTENYAKRLEQNREIGIVDQCVRSSSGWYGGNELDIVHPFFKAQ